MKTIHLDEVPVKLQIWDTAGQKNSRTLTKSNLRGAQGILVVYDVTDRDSFESVSLWMQEIESCGVQNPQILLVGNKCDQMS